MFHEPTNEKIICTAIAGFMIGSTIWLKVRNSPEPSIRAASTISIGSTLSRYCFM